MTRDDKEGYFFKTADGREVGPLMFNECATNYNHPWYIKDFGEFKYDGTSRICHWKNPTHDSGLNLIQKLNEACITLSYSELRDMIDDVVFQVLHETDGHYDFINIAEKLSWSKK